MTIESKIAQRPTPKELKDRNIIRDSNVSPALQSSAIDLEKAKKADSLNKGLSSRPSAEDLANRRILKG